MSNDPNSQKRGESSFLGGGPKFNQAGLNTPMPGEKVADAKPPPPLGGPRVWIGAVIVIVMIAVLWAVYGEGPGGTTSHGNRGGISTPDNPSVDPDAK